MGRLVTTVVGSYPQPNWLIDRKRLGERLPPRVRAQPVEVRDVEFLRALTDRRITITVPGQFAMAQQAQDDHYGEERTHALAYAEAGARPVDGAAA